MGVFVMSGPVPVTGRGVGVDVVAVAVFVPVRMISVVWVSALRFVGALARGRVRGRCCCCRVVCAGGAKADDREMGEARLVSEALSDLLADRVKLHWCERHDRAAALA